MPLYEYQILTDAGKPTGETFELRQPMKEEAWDRVPFSPDPDAADGSLQAITSFRGARCRRIIFAPRMVVKKSPEQISQVPDHLKMPMSRRESIVHWVPPGGVNDYRKALGGRAAQCVQDDGRVVYQTSKDERTFANAHEKMERRKAEKITSATEQARQRIKQDGVNPFSPLGTVESYRSQRAAMRAQKGQIAGTDTTRKIPKKLAKRWPQFA